MPLDKVLCGSKLGVARNWACKAISKLEPEFAAELTGHVELYDFAQALSPEMFSRSAPEKIQQALEALRPRVGAWPPKLQENMWGKGQRQDHNQILSACSDKAIEAFWRRCRPYKLASERDIPLDIFDPNLWMLEMPAEQRATQMHKCVAGVLVMLVKDGKHDKSVQSFSAGMKRLITKDLDEEDIDDEGLVASLMMTLDVCKALTCLLSKDLFQKLSYRNEVEEIKRSQRSIGSSVLVRVANAVSTSAAWQERLRIHASQVSALEVPSWELYATSRCVGVNDKHAKCWRVCNSCLEDFLLGAM